MSLKNFTYSSEKNTIVKKYIVPKRIVLASDAVNTDWLLKYSARQAVLNGYDTDCTCASAAALVGIVKGYSGLGEELTSLIKDYFICGIDVKRLSDSIRGLAEDTAKIALSIENECLNITDVTEELKNIAKVKPDIENIYPIDDGLKKAYETIEHIA